MYIHCTYRVDPRNRSGLPYRVFRLHKSGPVSPLVITTPSEPHLPTSVQDKGERSVTIECKYGNRVPKTKIRRKPDSFELVYTKL